MEETIINNILNRKTKRPKSNLNIDKAINIKLKRQKLIQKKFYRKRRFSSKYFLSKNNINVQEQSNNSYLKSKIRENSVLNFIKIFKEKEDFNKKGQPFIKELATTLEKELSKLYPAISNNYCKYITNMNKTLKEIIKYKYMNQLIINKNINLFKIAIIPYGEELTKKINKIINNQANKYRKDFNKNIEDNPETKIVLNPHLYEPLSINKINFKFFNPILYDINFNSYLKLKSNKKEIHIIKTEVVECKIENEDSNNEKDLNSYHKENNDKILRIYHGKIKLNHIYLDNISLFSTDNSEKIKKFPSLGNSLILKSKVETSKIIPYCLKHLNDKSRIQIFGWIEPDLNNLGKEEKKCELDKFVEIINEYDKEDKCSSLKDEKIKLYIFALKKTNDFFNQKIINDIKFNNISVKERLEKENKFLVFALISDLDFLNKHRIQKREKINPEIISQNIKKDSFDIDKNEKLRKIFEQKDFNIRHWLKKNFGNLDEKEKYNKLNKFNKKERYKILELIKKNRAKVNKDNNLSDAKRDNNSSNENLIIK